jgi:hypothetical protein
LQRLVLTNLVPPPRVRHRHLRFLPLPTNLHPVAFRSALVHLVFLTNLYLPDLRRQIQRLESYLTRRSWQVPRR